MAAQREWFEKDYYKILGVGGDASPKEITKAYRRLARQLHPDANPGDAKAEERFKEVTAAYDVVGDPSKRAEYDEVRRLGPSGGVFTGGPGGGPGGGFTFSGDAADLGDLFGGLFGRVRRSGGAGPAGPRPGGGPQRGDDLEAELHLSFLDAVQGVTTSVNITSDAPCQQCGGSGAAKGTRPKTCGRCGGRGVLDDNQGLFSFSQTCPTCAGRGVVVEEPCPHCRGAGVERRPREVRVRIPAGVEDGQRIRLKGRGGPGRNGAPAGDLYVTARVGDHPVFGRSGANLLVAAPISYPEAVLGADIAVPTLTDGPVTLRIPPGTRSGKTFRVKGRGVATATKTGDLLVSVELVVPQHPTAAEREAIEALAKVAPPPARAGGAGPED
ncbi:MAG: molecular chaperone DnaJ [Acidimicrobiales bacterium]